MNLHNDETVKRHADLVAEWATMTVAFQAYRSSADNPYRSHLQNATAALPKRVSLLACALAEARNECAGRSGRSHCYDPPTETIRPRNYSTEFYRVRRDLL